MYVKKSTSAGSDCTRTKWQVQESELNLTLPVDDLARFPEENPNPVLRARADGMLIYANLAGKTLLETVGCRVGKKLPSALRKRMLSATGVMHVEFDQEFGDRMYSVAISFGAAGRDINLYFRDVTSRKQAEEALQRLNVELEQRVAEQTSEIRRSYQTAQIERQRLYDVLETLPVYVVLLSPDYHVIFANRFFRELFGKSDGRRCFECLFDRSEPCENCETYKVLQMGAPHHWEWTGPNGRDYDVYDFPFTDSDGSPLVMEMGIDVTEQKRLEERLRTASLYSRSLIEASLDPLVTISPEGKVTDVNQATELATGVARDDLIGSVFSSYFTDPQKANEGYRKVISEGFVKDYPLTIRHVSGSTMDVLYNATVYKNAAGRMQGVFAAARDVTERKRAEEELKHYHEHLEELVVERTANLAKANKRLRDEIEERRKAEAALVQAKEDWERTFNSVPDLIALLDDRHKIVRVNRAMAESLGLETEQCIGLHCFECVHGADRPPAFCPHVCTLVDGREHSAEVHEDRLNGDFLVTTTPTFDAAGELIGSVHVARNVTEQKRAERELRENREDLKRAQTVARVGSWRLDVQHNKLLWSEENHRLFGIPVGTPLIYETFLDAVHPDDRDYVRREWSAALRGEPYDIEHRIVVAGQVKWVREKAELELDENGALLGGFGTSQDITERKLAQQALLELNETLEQRVVDRTAVAERRAAHLRRMAAELSQAEHRERNRLAKILHDDLQQLLLAARLRLAGIDGDGERLREKIEVVDGLLAECMGASRDLTMELSPPILHNGTLVEVLEWLCGWFKEKHGLSVVMDVSREIPHSREYIRVFLFQAIRELLMNTLKHSGMTEARISVYLEDDCLRIQVEDRGSGFDPAVVRQKLDRAHSFGLLSIRERLEALEGCLEFENMPAGGACFRLIVPLSAIAEPLLGQVANASAEIGPTAAEKP